MADLLEKSIQILELPRVLALLAAEAVSEAAKERSLALRPQIHRGEATRLLQETDAARTLMRVRSAPYFAGVKDVQAAVSRAEMGGSLNTRELLDVAALLRSARTVKDYGAEERREKTCIDHLFAALQTDRYLEDKITRAILSEEEISDAASPELADIRRHMRAASAKVREVLQRMISSAHYSKYLQDSIVTMRDGRYVVPVKVEHKGEVQGLVHDVSSSGATLFIEPMGAVQANNELKELEAKERKEIERILAELSAETAAHGGAILSDYNLLVALDCIFARGKLSARMNAAAPELSAGKELRLRRARHPLLDAAKAVPIDVELGTDFDTMIITGPNTGGKTVTLKTLGLFCLMAQCGLHLPVADGSCVPVFSAVLADIGDEQSIEQSLSTFSAHMSNIVRILEEADGETLVLFDELGAGTDPVEGAALAIAIIQATRTRGACIVATTHYAELKVFAMSTKGVCNAACEFDVETLRPTYKLLIGVPGKSNAFAIAQRLGLSENVIARAREQVDAGSLQFEDVLTQLEAQRQAMERARVQTEQLQAQAREDAKSAQEIRARMEQEREKATKHARDEARQMIEAAREQADSVFAELNEMRKRQAKGEDWQTTNEARAALRQQLNEAQGRIGQREETPLPPPTRPAVKGDTVLLVRMGTSATVESAEKDGTLRLRAGILNITAKQEEVRVVENAPSAGSQTKRIAREAEHKLRTTAPSTELDMRGMTADEGIATLEQFLDGATMAKLETVTIIHGKGTGALRTAVQRYLKTSRYVGAFRPGRYGEGEAGVTVVTLK